MDRIKCHSFYVPPNTPHVVGSGPTGLEIDSYRDQLLSLLIDVEAELVVPILDKKRQPDPGNYEKTYNKRMGETFNDKVKRYNAWLDRSDYNPANLVALRASLQYLKTIRNKIAHLPLTFVIENGQPFLFIFDGEEIYVFDRAFKEKFESSMAVFLTESRLLRQHLKMHGHLMFGWLDAYNTRKKAIY